MESAMAEIKEEPISVEVTPELHIPLATFFPVNYIMDIDQRLQAYRRLSQITSMKEIAQYREELEDRFGLLPEQVSNLLFKIMLKVLSQRAGVIRLDLTTTHVVFTFSSKGRKGGFGKVISLVQQNPDRFTLVSEYVLKIRLKSTRLNQKFSEIRDVLKELQ
jgi:transcription-repair coupling factor (superfamily II helicase)